MPQSFQTYFQAFLHRKPPNDVRFAQSHRAVWHLLAGMTLGLGVWYLHWRWTASLNPEAMVFSVVVAMAETMAFVGTALFFFDIWDEVDTPRQPPPQSRKDVGLDGAGDVTVDIYITTFDEDVVVVRPSVEAALALTPMRGVRQSVYVLDDGNRPEMRNMTSAVGAGYLHRETNRGYKAGNLTNALFRTSGDFVVICDADTQLFPEFLQNTLGYFRDARVAWVQTPHWFYDIPEGSSWEDWLTQRLGFWARMFAPLMRRISGQTRVGDDLFLANPVLFFDVIQRRRNRHNASFCCGAGSIHRREAVFDNALNEHGRTLNHIANKRAQCTAQAILPRIDLQPFRYHVSEDIFTSIQQHANGWISVYHPQVEARMLSPWSAHAWATQLLKYAGGTFDIMLRANPIFRRGMPWSIKLHYLSTFWSYLGALWLPILFMAPVISMFTGVAPVETYSLVFFMHILPMLIVNELALNFGCKSYDVQAGRILSIGTLSIQWRALLQTLTGRRPHFPPTPKTPMVSRSLRYALPNLAMLALASSAALWGVLMMHLGSEAHSPAFVIVNLFWLFWGGLSVYRVAQIGLRRPNLPNTEKSAVCA